MAVPARPATSTPLVSVGKTGPPLQSSTSQSAFKEVVSQKWGRCRAPFGLCNSSLFVTLTRNMFTPPALLRLGFSLCLSYQASCCGSWPPGGAPTAARPWACWRTRWCSRAGGPPGPAAAASPSSCWWSRAGRRTPQTGAATACSRVCVGRVNGCRKGSGCCACRRQRTPFLFMLPSAPLPPSPQHCCCHVPPPPPL